MEASAALSGCQRMSAACRTVRTPARPPGRGRSRWPTHALALRRHMAARSAKSETVTPRSRGLRRAELRECGPDLWRDGRGPALVAIDVDVHESAERRRFLGVLAEQREPVHDAGRAEMLQADRRGDHLREAQ